MAEVLPETTPEQSRQCPVACRWAADRLEARRPGLLVSAGYAAAAPGVRWAAATERPQPGQPSVGVKRRSRGEPGKLANCRAVVTAPSTDARRRRPLGPRRYLPENRAADPERRTAARVPAAREAGQEPHACLQDGRRPPGSGFAPLLVLPGRRLNLGRPLDTIHNDGSAAETVEYPEPTRHVRRIDGRRAWENDLVDVINARIQLDETEHPPNFGALFRGVSP